MTKHTRIGILGVGAALILVLGIWIGSTQNAEAPIASAPTTNEQITETSGTTTPETQPVPENPEEHERTPTTPPQAAPVSKPVVSAPVKTAPKQSFTLVTYNGKGFSPNNITIEMGDTVRFMNLSDEDMWIAADHHPTHTTYPIKTDGGCSPTIFDMCTSVEINEYWDFRFDREGTFGYHNHEKPVMNGEVEVNKPGEKPQIPGN